MRPSLALLFVNIVLVVFVCEVFTEPCNQRQAQYGPICVCNTTFCDTSPPLETITEDEFQLYETSEETLGHYSFVGTFNDTDANTANFSIKVNFNETYQKIVGFGSSFTDSAGQNVLSLPEIAQEKFLESNFADNGNSYSLCRVPIGGTDYSPRYYSYADVADPTLSNFTLQEEDLTYKIPFILKAKELRGEDDLQLIASAWTAPPWMKTNNEYTNIGFLKTEYYQTWADYYVKFFEAYRDEGVNFWGVTTQNEPATGFSPVSFPGMAWLYSELATWIANNFGPTIKNGISTNHLKILAGDEQKILLPFVKSDILDDENANQYIDGVAVHWYTDAFTPPRFLELAQSPKEDWMILNTEASNGFLYGLFLDKAVRLGSWDRAERYIKSILDDLDYGAGGWIDWNIALDVTGGPVNLRNNVDSPIIVNATAGEFYKQPMFYALGHFSKFLIPGSVRVNTEVVETNTNIRSISFLRPDGRIATIIWNKAKNDLKTQIEFDGKVAVVTVKARSINTVLYLYSNQEINCNKSTKIDYIIYGTSFLVSWLLR